MTKRGIQLAFTMGCCIARAIGTGACQPEAPGPSCGRDWCSTGMICVQPSNSEPGAPKICVVPDMCGNNYVDRNEECDDGAKNSDQGHCRTDCVLNRCGNGRLDPDEECDDGIDNGDDRDCRSDCMVNRCGDGFVNTHGAHPEECDGATQVDHGSPDVNPTMTATCNLDCTLSSCGDGKVNSVTEQCDPGQPGVDTETCNSNCTIARCGDRYTNQAAHEACDDGPENGIGNDRCDVFCQLAGCGNGIVEPGEQCDPGQPGVDTETCNSDCTLPVCGDRHTNQAAHEACDDGPNNGNPCDYGEPGCQRCNSTCTAKVRPGGPFCGDAQIDGTLAHPEACDQGPLNGTQCAYGDIACLSSATSLCKADCSSFAGTRNGPYCGDGIVQDPEECDPGGQTLTPADTATCNKDCTFPVCGDGHVNRQAGEKCDDRNTSACGTCSADCKTITSAAATGTIVAAVGDAIGDGDTFTLSDGFTQATFEFDSDNVVSDSHIAILFKSGDDAAIVAGNIISAVNGALQITASCATADPCTTVNLINRRATSLGNQKIIASDRIAGGFTGMSGGHGGDCGAGVGCVSGNDCSSGVCTDNRCQPVADVPMQSVLSEYPHQLRR